MTIKRFKLRTLIDVLAGLFKTCILFSEPFFSETDKHDEMIWKFLFHRSRKPLLYR